MCWTFEICGAGIFNRFLWARNDKAADQSGSFITSLSSHIQDSKVAAAPGSTFLAHLKDSAKKSQLNRFFGTYGDLEQIYPCKSSKPADFNR